MTTMPDGKFTKIKKVLVGVSGAIMLLASINLSKEGVGFSGDAVWIGIAIAVSLSCAEFMFNSNFEDMNWTILVIGLGAYIYSILTNISGFYSLQGIEGTIFNNFNLKALLGGVFMDVYPEIALAWALKESKVGDLLGNIFKTFANPNNMTSNQQSSSSSSSANPRKSQGGNLRNDVSNASRGGGSVRRSQLEHARNTPNPIREHPNEASVPSPNYHPVGMGATSQQARNNAQDSFDVSDFNFEA